MNGPWKDGSCASLLLLAVSVLHLMAPRVGTTQETAEQSSGVPEFDGIRTLVCSYAKSKVYELDAHGDVIWEARVPYAWGCVGLPSGHRVVASYSGKYIAEFDADGKEIWRSQSLPGAPFSVQRLENGNTLVPCSDSGKVVEISPEKEIVWEIELEGRPMDAQRLKNGRTLIALQKLGKVVEVNAEGDVVWEVNGHRGAVAASRLENGNTLICQQGDNKVVEVDAKGTVVWSQAELRNPYDVQRLPNRNTLIVDYLGVREFNQKGELVWQHASQGVSRVCRHW